MFDFWREATAASVPGFLCLSGRRRPENVSILSSLFADSVRDFVEYIGCTFWDSIAFVLNMAAFQDFRQLFILYYDTNFINDEDFVLLNDMFP